ncbi:shTK domain protein [Cooperia oncophora]
MATLAYLLAGALLPSSMVAVVEAQIFECLNGGAGPCFDRPNPKTGKSDCRFMSRLCGNPKYSDVMKTQCPKTCGFCGVGGSTFAPYFTGECKDMVNTATGKSDCGDRQHLCRDPNYEELMSQQCPQTCGYCPL